MNAEKKREKIRKRALEDDPTVITSKNRNRLAFGFAVMLVAMCGLMFRMGYWQIYKSDELRIMAADMQKVDTEIDPVRGTIYDSRMNTLAESVTEYELYAYTQFIYKDESISNDDKAKAILKLSEITEKDAEEIKTLLEGEENLVLIAEGLTREQVEAAEEVFGSNVVIKTKVSRYYPNGAFAAQVLGGVNADNIGRSGLEYEYNTELAGVKGRTVRITDNNGDTLSNGKTKYYKAQDGYNIVTTIDSVIQHFVEDALETGMERTGADAITCIVMDPKTGNILAMATTPEYDPNNSSQPSDPVELQKFEQMSEAEQTEYLSNMWKINGVSDIYEPGSTFKLIAAAAALESGAADENSTYKCKGAIKVDNYYLHCLHTHGKQNLKEAVGNSCNPALAQVALDMGAETFYNYIDLFGFNDQTGVDLPGEGYSIVKDPATMSQVDLATTGYGQGIAVTPLQILCAVNALGNDGILMKPKIVSKIVDNDGNVIEEMPDVTVRQVISKETADEMREIMEYYVSDAGGQTAYVPGYRVGGKTGTANRVSGTKYSAATNTSFVIMAPMDDPVISMICIVYRPTKMEYGSYTAGPIVKEIAEKSLEYLGVERQYTEAEAKAAKKKQVKVPDVTGMDSFDAIRNIELYNLKYTVVPADQDGKSFVVVDQYPKAGAKVEKGSTVYIYSE
ncbi:MAG: PASTA domain-containing protein [Clostridiales bacterium]|nr:PASTA domain-containing protein [Clostridiales bacterium]